MHMTYTSTHTPNKHDARCAHTNSRCAPRFLLHGSYYAVPVRCGVAARDYRLLELKDCTVRPGIADALPPEGFAPPTVVPDRPKKEGT